MSDSLPDLLPVDTVAAIERDLPWIPATQAETPFAVVDPGRAAANAQNTADGLAAHGLAWRPHVKTHKSRAMTRIQLAAGAQGLTVATLREAEVMADLSHDLLLAHPPVPGRVDPRRFAALLAGGNITVAVDSTLAVNTLRAAAREAGVVVQGAVEVDVGMGRAGVPDPEAAVRLARELAQGDGTSFRGILFYPGHIRGGGEPAAAVSAVSDRVDGFIEALTAAGLPPRMVSGGSTPTLPFSHLVTGCTEVRAGTCIFHDRDSVSLGVGRDEDLAYHIVSTVVSDAVPGQVVVDAGSKALAKEGFRGGAPGFGRLLDRPEVLVDRLSEEHGILDLSATDWRPRVGEQVRIVPNHVCVSVNLQDRLLVPDGADGFRIMALEARGRLPLAVRPAGSASSP
ncbi:MAG: D-TA family PLP-dependent enzyme [Gemmatimonadales bacterium]|nr:MAG: D-TA family PLP-dependent enzyme [Gemmatimonadales bacterium]